MKRLLIAWGVLAAGALAFHLWARSVEDAGARARDMRDRIGRLIQEHERKAIDVSEDDEDRIDVAAVRVIAPKATFLYAKDGAMWRCRSHFDAVCLTDAVDGLVRSLLEAEGAAETDDPRDLALYSLEEGRRWVVELLGDAFESDPSGDVRFRVELGAERRDGKGAYVRRQGNPRVWAIDTNPWTHLGASRPGLPAPMIDPSIVPMAWLRNSGRIDRVEVRGPKAAFELILRERELTDEEMRRGVSPFYWVLSRDGVETDTEPGRSMSYHAFLFRAPIQRVLAARAEDEPGEIGRIVFHFRDRDPAVLRLGPEDPAGGVKATFLPIGTLVSVANEVADLMLPDPATIATGDPETNPWQPYLRGP